jgi:hypothetical protein
VWNKGDNAARSIGGVDTTLSAPIEGVVVVDEEGDDE